MAYRGQPIPSTIIDISQVKISDGKSVNVTVPAGEAIEAGTFGIIDGFFGLCIQSINADENSDGAMIALQIEQAEYITDQIDTSKTFAKGSILYFDPAKKLFTDDASVANAVLAGRITEAKDSGNIIQFVLYPQNAGVATASTPAPTINIDTTLSKAGQAADAGAVATALGKKFNNPTTKTSVTKLAGTEDATAICTKVNALIDAIASTGLIANK